MINDVCNVSAPSGNEEQMREYIKEQLSGRFEEIKVDDFGNLVCRSGNGGLCIECGMDSCGIMIVSVEKDKAHLAGVGGINAEYLIDKKVVFKNGSFGIVRYDGKVAAESKISDLYLECESDKVDIGDFGVVQTDYCENYEKVFANGLGNRIGLAAVMTAAKKADKVKDLTIIFSAQKRLGARGIQAFFGANKFDTVITVDGAECKDGIKSGDGCFLVVVDKAGVCKQALVERIKNAATEKEIRVTPAVSDQDFCMAHITTLGSGAAGGAIAIPVIHKNRSLEGVSKSDFDETTKLLEILMKEF